MVIRRRVRRLNYSRRCAEGSAVQELRRQGIQVAPREEISYLVWDANTWTMDVNDARGTVQELDVSYYRKLLDMARNEVYFALKTG
jgi:hypothetical protein